MQLVEEFPSLMRLNGQIMCGITGKLNFCADEPVAFETIARMCGVMKYRGPDDEGIFLDANFGMGMRRLSIIDLSSGKQPIHNEDKSVWTVFNGEIYNYLDLRSQLQCRGHKFYTQTDTEVIVHLYEEYGEGFVKHLAGMFAIALWDRRRKQLILARDRLGIKPLYYSVNSHRIIFGSEIKALLQDGVNKDIDFQALHDYLSFNYIPGPRSIFTHIRKLPPGHILMYSRGITNITPYWKLRYSSNPSDQKNRSEEHYCEELYELLKTTVQQHLISDVPLGIFLSGGIDSSSLVALMRSVSSQRLRTFSIGFEEQSYDELGYARAVARQFGTEHHELLVRPNAIELLPELVRYFDEPFADSSIIPLYWVSKLARKHVKVALSGEGGDEVFAGYETYAAYKFAEIYKLLPTVLTTRIIPTIIRRLPVSHQKVSFDYKAKRFVDGALLHPAEGHFRWKVIFTEEAKAALYGRDMNGFKDPMTLYCDAYKHCTAPDPVMKLQHIDLQIYLPDDLLVKADRMSMANSLEVRVPFLDHRVVEFAASIPSWLKIRGLTKKYILKQTMARQLPTQVLKGKKRGFNVPLPIWFRHELRDFVHDILSPKRIKETGFFKPEVVAALIQDHESRHADLSRNIWGLLVLMCWYEEYICHSTVVSRDSQE
jgi:asparagine synthase (glutamine-hydrolysing)